MLAHAKINLFLHVIGKREDGHHLLESFFSKLSICDELRVEICDELICDISGYKITGDNIAMDAARKLQNFANCKSGAKITINKRIPVSGGLGGGSADAAAVLQLLIKIWHVKINTQELNELALSIGADVPFCLQKENAFVTGIGEIIRPIPKSGRLLDIVLINPGYEISTKKVFRNLNKLLTPANKENMYQMIFDGRNDLEDVAIEMHKELIEVKKALTKQKNVQLVRMSGSGPTYFAIFDNTDSAKNAQNHLSMERSGWLIWQDQINI